MQRQNGRPQQHQSSDKHSQINHLNRLLTDRQYRDTQRMFVIEGIRNIPAAADANFVFQTIVRSKRLLQSATIRQFITAQSMLGVSIVDVTPKEYRSFSTTEHASGIAAIVQQRRLRISDVVPTGNERWIAFTDVRSAGNLGSLVRTAAAVEAAGIILIGQSIDPFDSGLIRASMGAFFRMPFYRASWATFKTWQQHHRVTVIGACPSAKTSYAEAAFPRPNVVMLGQERQGLSSRQRKHCDSLVRIPMSTDSDSLNLAVAGSLLLYRAAESECAPDGLPFS